MTPQNQLHSLLKDWYTQNKRDLPWRDTVNPYLIWLSEIILQQTRVVQGLPYFIAFSETYPTVESLADASETEVLKLWQGLGYYSRARNMHKAAKLVRDHYASQFPLNAKDLQKLPGIGSYTAAAIASFCYNEAVAVLDGNVFRVLARLYGVYTPINTNLGRTEFQLLAFDFLDINFPAVHNQAIMELGALTCTPSNPNCKECPFVESCFAVRNGVISSLPVKNSAKPKRVRHFNYFHFITDKRTILIQKRKNKDIWLNLFQLPLIESPHPISDAESLLLNSSTITSLKFDVLHKSNAPIHRKHILTHQIIEATFWTFHISNVQIGKNCDIFEACLEEIQQKYPVPILIKNYLGEFNKSVDVY